MNTRKECFWIQQGSCTYELTALVTVCTRSVPDKMSARRKEVDITPTLAEGPVANDRCWERRIGFS